MCIARAGSIPAAPMISFFFLVIFSIKHTIIVGVVFCPRQSRNIDSDSMCWLLIEKAIDLSTSGKALL